ncbi:MAG: GTPase HflX [Oscillospiraceae bacterium]|nr:GTPase HflX [Oscillospiraceae bacterium]
MYDLTDTNESVAVKAVLIAPDFGEYDVNESLAELKELAKTAGAECIATLTQRRNAPDPATCIGSGALEEASLAIENLGAELVIFDCELTGSQTANVERILDCKVVDRTMLILDIFAQRARSAEGRLQVELAQQKYRLPRLVGKGTALSRLGGGIGTRGPGETRLEADRRHIRRRINALEAELKDVRRRRELIRNRRRKNEIQTVAIVGYTNVGKSTLLNKLTDAGVLAEDMLFATLDPTARALSLPSGRTVMLVDTVGLVRRLPHQLVDAFRSTLEEAADADLILNVCDASSPDAAEQCKVSEGLLKELGAGDTPVLTVLNKCDKLDILPAEAGRVCLISAQTGMGLDNLLKTVDGMLPSTHTRATVLIPYSEGGLLGELRRTGQVFEEEYRSDGVFLDMLIDNRWFDRTKQYLIRE